MNALLTRTEGATALVDQHLAMLPLGARCEVAVDDWAVFAHRGSPLGKLDSGLHRIDPAALRFLAPLFNGGAAEVEVCFVRKGRFPLRIDGPLGATRDTTAGLVVEPACAGEVHCQVVNPERLVYHWRVVRQNATTAGLTPWLAESVRGLFKSALVAHASTRREAFTAVCGQESVLFDAMKASQSELEIAGVDLVAVRHVELDFTDADLDRYRARR